jgi:hydroxymethylpyrimidine pyrophosphatase-like HAD family hydrolase
MNQTTYENLRENLLNQLRANTTYKIEPQSAPEYFQVAVWCKSYNQSWSLCFQNGDMNGDHKGEAVWGNAGADDGLDELLEILKKQPEFKVLIEEDQYWEYEYLKELINDFIIEIAEKEKMDDYFADEDEEDENEEEN